MIGVLERRGLLARSSEIHSGDIGVSLAPAAPASTPVPLHDPIKDGDAKQKLDEELLYGSA